MSLDSASVTAGLLHDTVEDTPMTFDAIKTLFGSEVESLVRGETKISKLPTIVQHTTAQSKQDEQAENLRQMFIAMTSDYRIIVIKLADRLHNMRTLRHLPPEKRRKVSRETLDIFAPLAHRIGLWEVKNEMEEVSFMYLYPSEYKRLNRMLRRHQKRHRLALKGFKSTLERAIGEDQMLSEQGVSVVVEGRVKETYSLWRKMRKRDEDNLGLINDVIALRVVLTPTRREGEDEDKLRRRGVWLCYHVLGLVQHAEGVEPRPQGEERKRNT